LVRVHIFDVRVHISIVRDKIVLFQIVFLPPEKVTFIKIFAQ